MLNGRMLERENNATLSERSQRKQREYREKGVLGAYKREQAKYIAW